MASSSETALTTSRLLAISQQKKSGLILCKAYHAEFAGPGAAIGSSAEEQYTAVIAIGSPEIIEVTTHEERQSAYSRRIGWIRWLQKIVDNPDPIQRTEKLFSSFEEFFGRQILLDLPNEILAMLAGVLPETVARARLHHRYLRPDEIEEIAFGRFAAPGMIALNPLTLQAFDDHQSSIVFAKFVETGSPLPCSA
jgi:hypothetical protein